MFLDSWSLWNKLWGVSFFVKIEMLMAVVFLTTSSGSWYFLGEGVIEALIIAATKLKEHFLSSPESVCLIPRGRGISPLGV